MIGRADIEGSKSNVAMNAWLPQGHAFTGCISTENQNQTSFYPFVPHKISMCRPSQTPHLTMSSARIDPPKRVLGLKEGVVTPPPIHRVSKITRALLLIKAWLLPRRPDIGRTLQRHPFSGLVDSADERFARQYCCGPPPEFPLASPRSGIVHHLSGPDRYAHTRTLLRRSRSVSCAPVRDPANQLPCALRVYSPVDSHTCLTPWSVFQDGSNGEPTADALSTQMPRHAVRRMLQTTIKAATSPQA
ncbi:unnamed protein product [Brassica rapa subsp. trilocularis]